ncbi:MAG: GAF domain-containing protein [Pseudomonadota bacterium]
MPERERERLEALRRFRILDTPAEAAFDQITRAVARKLDVPMALVSLVDEERQWFKSCRGLEARETPREQAFCAHALERSRALVVPDAAQDPRFQDNPLVTGPLGVRSYCGAPLRLPNGLVLGTLCVIDKEPRTFSESEIAFLEDMAPVVVSMMEFRLAAQQEISRESAAAQSAQRGLLQRSQALADAEERFGDLAANLPGLVYRLRMEPDGRHRLLFISKSVERLLGLDAASVIANPDLFFGALHPEDSASCFASLTAIAETGATQPWQGRLMGAGGVYGWFRGSATPRQMDDGSLVMNGILLEITEQVRAEEGLRQAQKLQAIGQLTSGIAHDFNNLLAVVQGNAELLGDRVGEDHPAVGAILRVATRGAELTERLLAFSRQQSLSPQAVDLGLLVSDVAGLLRRTLGRRVQVETTAVPDLWLASADPGQMENALVNLALNARDAMPNGGVIEISCTNLSISDAQAERSGASAGGDYVVLRVRDEGQGMSAAVQARAFEPFFTTKESGSGSGLGLSMVYGFVRQSGGQVLIESASGQGTAISIWLPRARAPEENAADDEAGVDLRGKGERVLVIDDNEDVAVLVTRLLEDLGYVPVTLPDAQSALRRLAQDPFDLVLCDLQLPGTGGKTFLDLARGLDPDLRLVFMSGDASDSVMPQRDADGGLLMKPFSKVTLGRVVQAALAGASVQAV